MYTIRPALENIPKNVITSNITNQFPIVAAPCGNGRLKYIYNLILSTCNFKIAEKKAIIYALGKAKPNRHKYEN